MKKLALCIMGLLLLVGCSETHFGLSSGTYRAAATDDELFAPAIWFDVTLDRFTFGYDVLSSYLPAGSIEIENGIVTAATSDGKYTYKFRIIDNDTIAFIQKGSDVVRPIQGDSPLPDGTEFKFTAE